MRQGFPSADGPSGARLGARPGDRPSDDGPNMDGPSGSRLHGIDVARGLAVLGMMAAHVGVRSEFDFAAPGSWLAIVDGRSSILFATLAGVSLALLSGRTRPVTGERAVRVRLRILIRAVIIFALGGLLIMLATPVGVILEFYAVMFALSLPFLRFPPGRLFALAGAFALIAPLVNVILIESIRGVFRESAIIELLVTGQYPVLIWMSFLFAGLGIGRLDLTSVRVQTSLLLVGAALAVLGYSVGVYTSVVFANLPGVEAVFTVEPHSGSPFEVIGSGGFAIAVIGLCLLITDRIRWVLYPIEATGSMPLTVYSLHILAIALNSDLTGPAREPAQDNSVYLTFLVVTLVAATAWKLLFGAGPFERWLAWLAERATTATAPVPAGTVAAGKAAADVAADAAARRPD